MNLDLAVPGQLTFALLPELLVMAGAMVLLLWSTTRAEDDPTGSRPIATGAIGICLAGIAGALWFGIRGVTAGSGPIAIDNFRWAADIVVLIGTILGVALADDYTRRSDPIAVESYPLMLLSASGMMLLAGARDLIVVFLGIELMSIATYVLAAINRRSARSAEAGLKYFLLGAFSTAFLL